MLRKKYDCVFITQKPDQYLSEQMNENCDSVISLPLSRAFSKESRYISKEVSNKEDIIVLDGYNFDTNYQKELKKNCFKLVCVDDLHEIDFVADVIINHSEGISKADYLTTKQTRIYLGTKYAILRKSFRKSISVSAALEKQNDHNVFINMGGTDPDNNTLKALQICLTNKSIRKINIVIGSFYKHNSELEKIISKNENVRIKVYKSLSEVEICKAMKNSSAAICSSSTISYEYASVGGLLFVIQTASNQKNIYDFLVKEKVAFPAEKFTKIYNSYGSNSKRRKYFEDRLKFFDGKSSLAINSIFKKIEVERNLEIRRADEKDMLTYFKWVNDSEVRRNSIQTSKVKIADHKKWFKSRIKNNNSELYIIEKKDKPIGQVRFDRNLRVAEIDYSIENKRRGMGYGEIALRLALTEYKKTHKNFIIKAKVKRGNVASNRVFDKLGFFKRSKTIIQKKEYNNYELELNEFA